ncbi:MAG: uracil-DNA glycosylase [Verrucomicrobiae bacterium]|nr:uracil-DNA glycosylase [Verrucomicrobiae bacterium]MCX7721575.1 uracil-DNA glycosylase [Verrucomicrobiae bacterium]
MSQTFNRLLDAAISYLEALRAEGVHYVIVAPDTLAALTQPVQVAAPPQPELPARSHQGAEPEERIGLQRESTGPVEMALPIGLPGQPTGESLLNKPALPPQAKAAAFAELRQRVLVCTKCPHLAASRKNVVFGVGNINAELMFVGEAPGVEEDEQGEPFVGRAGELLTKIIQTMGLRREDVYICNVLKCRPDTPGQPTGNRKPTTEEMRTCLPYLIEQIELIRPKVIVALGATAMEGLFGKPVQITKIRGQWHEYRGIPVMPTYHPAYLLRNQAVTEKRKVWEDMLAVMEKLGLPISDKQRNYFRSG